MRRQINRLTSLMETQPHIKIMILPFSAGAHSGADGPFILLEFPPAPEGLPDTSDPRAVYLDNLVSALYLEEPDQIMQYSAAWDGLCTQALSPEASYEMLRKLGGDL